MLVDSERVWDDVRQRFTASHGGRWSAGAQEAMMGMSSAEWAAFMHDELHVSLSPAEIVAGVADEMADRYRRRLPLLPGAQAAVRRVAGRWPLGVASSSNRSLIDLVLDEAGLASCFRETLSTEEVGRGKPAPDVYLEIVRRMGAAPERCAGVEDSTSGLRALEAAGLRAIAVPNRDFPPTADALAVADRVIANLDELTFDVIDPTLG